MAKYLPEAVTDKQGRPPLYNRGRKTMSCIHLLGVPGLWQEYICGISGVYMTPEDCPQCRLDCLPYVGLLVELGKVRLEDLPLRVQGPAYQASLQAADAKRLPSSIKREAVAVTLGTWPAEVVETRAKTTAKALTRARRSASAKKVWARMTEEERKAQTRGLAGPHRRGGTE